MKLDWFEVALGTAALACVAFLVALAMLGGPAAPPVPDPVFTFGHIHYHGIDPTPEERRFCLACQDEADAGEKENGIMWGRVWDRELPACNGTSAPAGTRGVLAQMSDGGFVWCDGLRWQTFKRLVYATGDGGEATVEVVDGTWTCIGDCRW